MYSHIFSTAILALGLQLPLRARGATLPAGWGLLGCFIDNTSAGRLLTTYSGLPTSTMTPQICVNYCAANNWPYAGVEYGGECWCDVEYHEAGSQYTSSSACNMPCNGDHTQVCGGSNLIDVYWNANDLWSPGNAQTLSLSNWEYSGCFVDSTSDRTLPVEVQPIGGVTPPSCADACAFHGYTISGTEYGQECWCGNSTGGATQVPDGQCAMTCNVNRQFYCGDANRLTVYHNNPPQANYVNECGPNTGFNASDFSLMAVPKELSPSQSGWDGSLLRIIDILTENNTTWSILSACQNCNVTWNALSFGSGTAGLSSIIPTVFYPSNPGTTISIDLVPGGNVVFQTQTTLPSGYSGYTGYCAAPYPYSLDAYYTDKPNGSPVLLGAGHADDWAVCPNNTAFPVGRLDLVFQPSVNSPSYDLEECIAVDLFVE